MEPGDLLVLYSDGITEAESPSGAPFDEEGLMAIIRAHADNPSLPEIGKAVIKAVERHAQDVRFSDDLTILLARRTETRDSGSGTRDSGGEDDATRDGVPPITSPQLASFRRKPESSHPLDPGIRRGDDSIGSEPPAHGEVSVPPVPSPESRVPNPESRTPPPAPRS